MEVPNNKARENNRFKFYHISTDFHDTSLIRGGRLSKRRQSRIPEHLWRCASSEGRRAMTTGKACVAYVKKEAGPTLTSELPKPSAVYTQFTWCIAVTSPNCICLYKHVLFSLVYNWSNDRKNKWKTRRAMKWHLTLCVIMDFYNFFFPRALQF